MKAMRMIPAGDLDMAKPGLQIADGRMRFISNTRRSSYG
jgi:hypothetical protein